MTTASIIIRTKNESRSLGATLESVFSQRIAPHEVFVVDSGSRDATLEIAARYPVKIRHIAPKEFNYSRALNIAAREATGEFLVCLSAHCPPVDNEWLANLLRHFDDPSVAAVWGANLEPGRDSLEEGAPVRQEPGSYGVSTRQWGLNNANSALRRSLWREFPFDETLPATEDKAWALEAMSRNYCLIYDPQAAVWHADHPMTNMLKRNRSIMAGYARLFPELRNSEPHAAWVLIRGMGRRLVLHARQRDVRKLWLDLKKAPSTVAAIIGNHLGNH